jgi:hypothetical protein
VKRKAARKEQITGKQIELLRLFMSGESVETVAGDDIGYDGYVIGYGVEKFESVIRKALRIGGWHLPPRPKSRRAGGKK